MHHQGVMSSPALEKCIKLHILVKSHYSYVQKEKLIEEHLYILTHNVCTPHPTKSGDLISSNISSLELKLKRKLLKRYEKSNI